MTPINVETMSLTAKKTITLSIIAAIVFFGVKGAFMAHEKYQDNLVIRKESICPALFSISRSARDTLIVMKAEPLCNSFVLDNLK